MAVAFLGLGAIGTPMAAHLAQPGPLFVWNRTRAKAVAFASTHGATAVETPRDAASAADIVITCLPTSQDVEALLFRPDGILQGLRPGSLFLDCTSGDPGTSRRLAAELAQHGVAFADAPVSGGVSGAVAGTLTVMVGSDRETFERARSVLQAFGQRIEHVGPVGAGHAVKAINNALLAVNVFAVGEALAALVKAGVPAQAALNVVNASSGRSFVSEVLVPERVLNGAWPRTFRLALLDKDVGIARSFVRETGMDAPVLDLAGMLLAQARAELGEDADHVEAIRLIEENAGVRIRS
jgi:3-hydroxyisobutyrate dehydrogenase